MNVHEIGDLDSPKTAYRPSFFSEGPLRNAGYYTLYRYRISSLEGETKENKKMPTNEKRNPSYGAR